MDKFIKAVVIIGVLLSFSLPSQAQILVDEATEPATTKPRVGKEAATDYFRQRENNHENNTSQKTERSPNSDGDRYMLLGVGTFLNDKAYRWGVQNRKSDVGKAQFGVTYRVGEWRNSMDLLFRGELMSYDVENEEPLKLSLMPIIAFPDARSDFPLYFGIGAGIGVFFKQADNESDLSFDYAVITGLRFPALFDWGGLFIETGLKGQVHLLSSGQQDGVFITVGTVFIF